MAEFADKKLSEATVQEIQLTLIERAGHPKVVEDLLTHSDWWEAVLIQSLDLVESGKVQLLVRLRDLPLNIWNADLLIVVASSEHTAQLLATHASQAWHPDEVDIYSDSDTWMALGSNIQTEARVVLVWWD